MTNKSYVHIELVRRAEVLLGRVCDLWDGKKFQDTLFTWAGEEIKDDEGHIINDLVGCDLPEDSERHSSIMLDMVIRTKACAIMRIRRNNDQISAIIETPYGSKSWKFPFHIRGDRRVVGSPTIQENEEHLGILWKKNMGVC